MLCSIAICLCLLNEQNSEYLILLKKSNQKEVAWCIQTCPKHSYTQQKRRTWTVLCLYSIQQQVQSIKANDTVRTTSPASAVQCAKKQVKTRCTANDMHAQKICVPRRSSTLPCKAIVMTYFPWHFQILNALYSFSFSSCFGALQMSAQRSRELKFIFCCSASECETGRARTAGEICLRWIIKLHRRYENRWDKNRGCIMNSAFWVCNNKR